MTAGTGKVKGRGYDVPFQSHACFVENAPTRAVNIINPNQLTILEDVFERDSIVDARTLLFFVLRFANHSVENIERGFLASQRDCKVAISVIEVTGKKTM